MRAALLPSATQSSRPSGLRERCRAGPGTATWPAIRRRARSTTDDALPLRVADVGDALRRVHRRVPRLAEAAELRDDRRAVAVSTRLSLPCAVWATSACPKTLASMLRGPRRRRDPLQDATRVGVDRDQVRLEVGGDERARPRRRFAPP